MRITLRGQTFQNKISIMKPKHVDQTGQPCYVCGEGILTSYTVRRDMEKCGFTVRVSLHMSSCDTCGSEVAGKEEIDRNAEISRNVRKYICD